MAKRVDFSLGMKDISSGALLGDVYEDRRPVQVPGRGARHSEDAASVGRVDRARSTAHEHPLPGHLGLHRASTESQGGTAGRVVSHRNRFFGQGNRTAADDDDQRLMEQGMAAIPEGAGSGSGGRGSAGLNRDFAPRLQVPTPEPGLQRTLAARPAAEGSGAIEMGQLHQLPTDRH